MISKMMMSLAEIMKDSDTMLDAGELKAGRSSGPVKKVRMINDP